MVAATLVLTACGSSDDKTETKKDAGSVDSGKGEADSGKPEPVVVMCSSKPCSAPPLTIMGLDVSMLLGSGAGAGFAPTACCTEKGDKCGVSQSLLLGDGCIEQNQEGHADGVCPGQAAPIPLIPKFEGCCKPNNKCGIDLSVINVGCLERTEASAIGMNLGSIAGGAGVDAGAPVTLDAIACNYAKPQPVKPAPKPDAGTPADDASVASDAGASDAN